MLEKSQWLSCQHTSPEKVQFGANLQLIKPKVQVSMQKELSRAIQARRPPSGALSSLALASAEPSSVLASSVLASLSRGADILAVAGIQ